MNVAYGIIDLTRIRRIFVIKGEHFFAYRNDSRYQSWQIWVGDSPNFGRGFFDQPKRATAIDSESFRELRSIAATFAYFDSQNSERVARRHC